MWLLVFKHLKSIFKNLFIDVIYIKILSINIRQENIQYSIHFWICLLSDIISTYAPYKLYGKSIASMQNTETGRLFLKPAISGCYVKINETTFKNKTILVTKISSLNIIIYDMLFRSRHLGHFICPFIADTVLS